MRSYRRLFLILSCIFIGSNVFSQSKDAKALVDTGVALYDRGKYNEAIEKYKQALIINPNDLRADFEIAYTLQTLSRGIEAIPYLAMILKSNASKYETYELLGSIYDDNNQSEKAVESYKAGIKEKPDFERLHFNLSITYLRLKNYPEGESEAINAIKLDPKHASAQRAYALATLYQNKKLCAIVGFCNFLLLEPQSERSKEVYQHLDKIFKDAAEQKNINITIDKNSKDISAMSFSESSIVMAASTNKALENINTASSVERLTNELKMIFTVTAEQSKKQRDKDFFWNFYADYFGKLAQTSNMPAFARLISLSAYKDENLAWFREHDKELNDLNKWLSTTERSF